MVNQSPLSDTLPGEYTQKRKLKELATDFLNANIQSGHHSSIIDARVALALYRKYQNEIEHEFEIGQTPFYKFEYGQHRSIEAMANSAAALREEREQQNFANSFV